MKADPQSSPRSIMYARGLKATPEPRKKWEESVKEEHITPELTKVAFLFFYRFSRFEFALKENGFLKNTKRGARAEPNWDRFVNERSDGYHASSEARELIEQAPRQQVVEANCSHRMGGRQLGRLPNRPGKSDATPANRPKQPLSWGKAR